MAYSQQFNTSSFVVRDGMVIITEFKGNKFHTEVKVPVKDFLKAAIVITAKEGK